MVCVSKRIVCISSKKQDVAIKYVHKNTFNVNSVIKNEIYQIRHVIIFNCVIYVMTCSIYRLLDHPNLCKFVGASVEAPKIAILMEYCPKGSLYDVLQNKEIHFSWGFRFSFADDIAAGMAYLHSKGILHSRLKSSNCLINDRWVLKITGIRLNTVVCQCSYFICCIIKTTDWLRCVELMACLKIL